jgi:radical SAM superfamily enzyme YgiQ (UPF0313 family)
MVGLLERPREIFLIHAPISERYQDASQHYAPPAGLISLKTAVQRAVEGVDITVLDGTQVSLDSMIKAIVDVEPDLVGVSIQQLSYDNALSIAAVAKEIGSTVVFGGQQATQLAPSIIANRHEIVDAVVSHDGEVPLILMCNCAPFEYIPGLSYWRDGARENPSVPLALDALPWPDYDDISLQPYARCYTARRDLAQPGIFLRTYSHKGCGNRQNSSACYFCGRADRGVRFKSPRRFVGELLRLQERWGATEVFDVGDDIGYAKPWLSEVADLIVASGLSLKFGCFGRASRLRDPEVVQILQRMGVSNVVIGFESGDENLLNSCGKGNISPQDNLTAAQHLFDVGIDVCASYVVGLPGESECSLQHTFENAAELIELARERLGRAPYELVCNLFEPSPGSPAFCQLKRKFPAKYHNEDRIDLEEAQHDYFRSHWCFTSKDEVDDFRKLLVRWAKRINSLTTEADCQGFLATEMETPQFAPS